MQSVAGFRAHSSGSRAAGLLLIFGAHAAAISVLVATGGLREIVKGEQPILVQVIPEPPRNVEAPRPLPLPPMRMPDIHLPSPPPLENLFMVQVQEKVVTTAPAPVVAAVTTAPPSPTPSLEPPRGDIAYLNNPVPMYPAVSKRSGEQGRVLLRVLVDERGSVQSIEVEKSSGFSRLDEAALAAVRRWRFLPARLGERNVAGSALVPISFNLRG
jgi:periplasmic protein TonB